MPIEQNASLKLVSHVIRYRDQELDEAVRRRSGLCLLDSLACFFAGLSLPHFAQSAAAARSSFLGNGGDVRAQPSPFMMAYVYGQAANALDFDDTLHGHPGSPIVGALLAAGATRNLSLDRILRGIAAGYDAHWILAEGAAPSKERASVVRSIGVFDTVAASIGVLVALGASNEVIERVIGVALPHSILPYVAKWYERPVPAMKNNMGWVAAGAILSANLALAGQTGVTCPLDGDTAMWRMAGSDQWFIDDHFHDSPAVLRTGFKPYPGCWHTQEILKAFAELLEEIDEGDEIVEIIISGPADVEKFCDPCISGPADIAFSLPALFERMASRLEPGPLWDHLDEGSFTGVFRYERSDTRNLSLLTRKGRELKSSIPVSVESDLAPWGLNDEGVIAKFSRFADLELRDDLLPALSLKSPSNLESIPGITYRSIMTAANRVLEA
ncbi:MmgE/PrpD family protein (plasmid) [Agrobacterium vitis]|uniref:MmgE/PrpD family protein n=1 Tax=Agrobacterium vitis TaxID=373 RepID=UPI0012E92831|nr:MmgE/PrpD family protein [Agrobacterium vitis]MVA27099.1 hypothetical protein [Agrobacterium vitis]